MQINLDDINNMYDLFNYIIEHVTYNGCGDEDCCGGPYTTENEYNDCVKELKDKYGLEFV